MQLGIQEGIRRMLINDGFAFEVSHSIMNIRAAVTGDEKGCIGLFGDMLNVDMVAAAFAETLQDDVRLLRGFQRVGKRVLPAGEMIFLKIDNQQGCLHGLKYSRT